MNLNEIFTANGISCAHVIDDAYNTGPVKGLENDDVQAFLDAAADEDLTSASSALNIVDSEEALRLAEPERYAELYLANVALTAGAREALFGTFEKYRQGKRDLITPLVDLLTEEGLECHCFGASYDPTGKPVPQLVFIDLKLREDSAGIDHKDAVSVVVTLQTKLPQSRPFVFLMSSLSLHLPLQREPFREEAKLFQSEFEAVDKALFSDTPALTLMLASNTRAMPQVSRLRDCINLLESSVATALEAVMKELRALDLADYFVLYHNTTSTEDTTVGSYIVEQILEFLSHEVEGTSAIWDIYKGIEGLNVQKLPRARFGLTMPAARLYSANMLHSTKRLMAEESLARGPSNGYFYLGDIFCDAKWLNTPLPAKAYAVITPACDIARPVDMIGMNMLLCEGEVSEFIPGEIPNVRDALPVVVMPNIRDTNRNIIISWDKAKILIWNDVVRAKFAGADCSFVRIGRLRPVYAMQLQHAVTTNLSRVGTLRPPSILAPRQVRCYVSDGLRWKNIFRSDDLHAGAIATLTDRGEEFLTFVLSDPAVSKIIESLALWLENNLEADKATILRKVTGDAVIDALQGFRYKMPKPVGDKNDVTAFPLAQLDDIGKVVAFVPSRLAATPFQAVRNASKTKKDRDTRLLFVFEDDPEIAEPADVDPNAPKPPRPVAPIADGSRQAADLAASAAPADKSQSAVQTHADLPPAPHATMEPQEVSIQIPKEQGNC